MYISVCLNPYYYTATSLFTFSGLVQRGTRSMCHVITERNSHTESVTQCNIYIVNATTVNTRHRDISEMVSPAYRMADGVPGRRSRCRPAEFRASGLETPCNDHDDHDPSPRATASGVWGESALCTSRRRPPLDLAATLCSAYALPSGSPNRLTGDTARRRDTPLAPSHTTVLRRASTRNPCQV